MSDFPLPSTDARDVPLLGRSNRREAELRLKCRGIGFVPRAPSWVHTSVHDPSWGVRSWCPSPYSVCTGQYSPYRARATQCPLLT